MSKKKFDGELNHKALDRLGREVEEALAGTSRRVQGAHLDVDLILRFLEGEESPTISAHLETCEQCAAWAAQIADMGLSRATVKMYRRRVQREKPAAAAAGTGRPWPFREALDRDNTMLEKKLRAPRSKSREALE